eukprot:TRINITY_DN5520_c0_g1_i14.p1 TRINITY_DN5520_c0_g1~~TRINITY_DN5520_c0_g1_i14.p1  ORF type:complete len:231 (-),score=-23.81 TRINITY_DN5520_c0_g1_i14:415-1107(-)
MQQRKNIACMYIYNQMYVHQTNARNCQNIVNCLKFMFVNISPYKNAVCIKIDSFCSINQVLDQYLYYLTNDKQIISTSLLISEIRAIVFRFYQLNWSYFNIITFDFVLQLFSLINKQEKPPRKKNANIIFYFVNLYQHKISTQLSNISTEIPDVFIVINPRYQKMLAYYSIPSIPQDIGNNIQYCKIRISKQAYQIQNIMYNLMQCRNNNNKCVMQNASIVQHRSFCQKM